MGRADFVGKWLLLNCSQISDNASSLRKIFPNFYRRLNYGIVKLQLITTQLNKSDH